MGEWVNRKTRPMLRETGRACLIFVAVLAFLPAGALGQEIARELPPAEAERVLSEIARAQANVRTIRATIVQRRSSALLKNDSVTEGRLEAKRPNFVRWDVDKPSRSIAWIRPDGVTIYYPDRKLAKKPPQWAVARAAGGLDLVFAFSERPLDEIYRDFTARVSEGRDGVLVNLLPRRDGLPEMSFIFSRPDYSVREIALTPQGGRTITMTFRSLVTNAPIPDARFLPDLPPGTTIGEM